MSDGTASAQIDAIIERSRDWRGITLSELRTVIKVAYPAIVEEVKWKKPSRSEGVPVWEHDGIVCVADMLVKAVRLTFPKGARLHDPMKIFNARLESNTARAIDLHEGDAIDKAALASIVVDAAKLNASG